jgi:Uma2 family endonuclease
MPRVLVSEPTPPAVQALLDQRRRAGADTHDEMWNGVLHMAPAPRDVHAVIAVQLAELLGPVARAAGLVASAEFNLGSAEDYRVPDMGLHREQSWGTYALTAALVVEILSPSDDTWEKLPFYATHDVDELIVVDPDLRTIRWLALTFAAGYGDVERSALIDLGPDELADRLNWPAVS